MVADDGVLGRVDGLLVSETHGLAYLIVRAGRCFRRRYPVVPVELVTHVDNHRRLVRLRGRRDLIEQLTEQLPFVV